jgi:hypothetical protein
MQKVRLLGKSGTNSITNDKLGILNPKKENGVACEHPWYF